MKQNRTAAWDSSRPILGTCFCNTVLRIVPCFLLWLTVIPEVYTLGLKRSTSSRIPWSFVNSSRLILALTALVINVAYVVASLKGRDIGLVPPVDYSTPVILIVSYSLVCLVLFGNRAKGVIRSPSLWMFYVVSTVFEGINLSQIFFNSDQVRKEEYYLELVYFPILVMSFLLVSIPDKKPLVPDNQDNMEEKVCPLDTASYQSVLMFLWAYPMLWFGFKKDMTKDDVFHIREEDKAKSIGSYFRRFLYKKHMERVRSDTLVDSHVSVVQPEDETSFEYSDEVLILPPDDSDMELKEIKKNRGIISALVISFAGELIFSGMLKLVLDMSQLSNPWLLKWLLKFVDQKDSHKELEPLWHGLFIVMLMFVVNTLINLVQQRYFYSVFSIGFRVKTSLQSTIYRKAMVIGNADRKRTTVGEMVNLMSVDADRFQLVMSMIHLIWACPLQVSIIIYLLYLELGVSCFAGVAVLVLVLPINFYASQVMEKVITKQMELKDTRVKSMNEILNGIKVLKLYAWEPAFMKQILGMRDLELKHIMKIAYLEAVYAFMWTAAPLFVALASFALFVTIDQNNVLDAEKVFVSLLLFNLLRQPLSHLPYLMTTMVMVVVSTKRLNRFFEAPDLEKYVTRHHDDYAVSFEDASFTWGANAEEEEDFLKIVKDKKKQNGNVQTNSNGNIGNHGTSSENEKKAPFELKDININISDESLVAVVGVVGSGKSSLLNALLGEMQRMKGGINISPRIKNVAYVSQQAWIQNISLKDNILFGKQLDEKKYQEILRVCELKPDLDMLPAGDLTEIGEKGINLSGGQKQRLNLARACYSQSDLMLLDDPLSAVDSHVAKKLFDNVIGPKGILRKKTRILVTNHLSILPYVDQIVVLKEGKVSEVGTYKELTRKEGDFAEFIKTFSNNKKNESQPTTPAASLLKSPDFMMRAQDLMRSRSMSITSNGSQSDRLKEDRQVNNAAAGGLIEDENIEKGSVKLSVYYQYFKVVSYSSIVLICLILMQTSDAGSNIWLALWSQDKPLNTTTGPVIDTKLRNERLIVYGFLGFSTAFLLLIASLVLARGSVKASMKLHEKLLHQILRSPMSFFETTPTGRIVNRFSKDLDSLDLWLAEIFLYFILCCFQTISSFVVIIFATPIFAVVVIPTVIVYILVQKFYVTTQRQVKRLESATRSPVYSHFSETLNGASTIRAFGIEDRFITNSDDKIDANLRCSWTMMVLNRWLAVVLSFIGNSIVMFAGLFAVLSRESLNPGLTGLAITYAMSISQFLNWFVQLSTQLETEIVCVERVLEYSNNKTEAEWNVESTKPPVDWPTSGVVEFQGLSTRYREGLDLVLNDINVRIEACEKIGIVGRTGAGKSTITLSLLRIIEAAEGRIVIDGVDIETIGLHDLRSKMTIIPQDPVLFSGSLRFNLDPFHEKTDEEIWRSLDHAHLKSFVQGLEKQLEYEVSEGGANLSVGQRQLVCMARALLRKSKLLILDEATAAIDLETDALIQKTIRSEFADCTVLTIAHRLHTILDSSRVLVLDAGKVAEFEKPQDLLDNPNSIFHSLAKDAGIL